MEISQNFVAFSEYMNFDKLPWSNSLISDSNGKKISNELTINHEVDTFTCEFTTSLVGEHTIEIFIKNEKIDATPSFYTYDATKIKVGDIPPGNVGMPVDFVGKFCFLCFSRPKQKLFFIYKPLIFGIKTKKYFNSTT